MVFIIFQLGRWHSGKSAVPFFVCGKDEMQGGRGVAKIEGGTGVCLVLPGVCKNGGVGGKGLYICIVIICPV